MTAPTWLVRPTKRTTAQVLPWSMARASAETARMAGWLALSGTTTQVSCLQAVLSVQPWTGSTHALSESTWNQHQSGHMVGLQLLCCTLLAAAWRCMVSSTSGLRTFMKQWRGMFSRAVKHTSSKDGLVWNIICPSSASCTATYCWPYCTRQSCHTLQEGAVCMPWLSSQPRQHACLSAWQLPAVGLQCSVS